MPRRPETLITRETLPLPHEIFNNVLRFLNLKDVVNFSASSYYCHEITKKKFELYVHKLCPQYKVEGEVEKAKVNSLIPLAFLLTEFSKPIDSSTLPFLYAHPDLLKVIDVAF